MTSPFFHETHKSISVNFTQTSHKFSFRRKSEMQRRRKKKGKKRKLSLRNKLERTRPLEVSNFIPFHSIHFTLLHTIIVWEPHHNHNQNVYDYYAMTEMITSSHLHNFPSWRVEKEKFFSSRT